MKQWKKYVGFDQWDQSSAGQVAANPGPLDNANIFKGTLIDQSCIRTTLINPVSGLHSNTQPYI